MDRPIDSFSHSASRPVGKAALQLHQIIGIRREHNSALGPRRNIGAILEEMAENLACDGGLEAAILADVMEF